MNFVCAWEQGVPRLHLVVQKQHTKVLRGEIWKKWLRVLIGGENMAVASSQNELNLLFSEVQSGGCFQHKELVNKPWSSHHERPLKSTT